MALPGSLGLTTTAAGADAVPMPVGAGFTVTAAVLAYRPATSAFRISRRRTLPISDRGSTSSTATRRGTL
jgi:hypothetical protein